MPLDSELISEFLKNGGNVFFLPRSGSNEFLGVKLKPAGEKFAGSLSAPAWPETRGLSASDLRWRSYLDSAPWVIDSGAEIGADGLIGRKKIGKGTAIFCQIDPDGLSADEKTYFRYTRWRATRAVAQLLVNLGATFAVDDRIFHPLDTWETNLDGPWQMQVTLKLSTASTESAEHPDSGIGPEARRLINESTDNTGWSSVTLPQMLPFFKENVVEAVFRKEVVIPKELVGKNLKLSLGMIVGSDEAYFNGNRIGRTKSATAQRDYEVPGQTVRAGTNVIAFRLFNSFGPGGFAGKPGFSMAPTGDRSGPQATGPRIGLEMSLTVMPQGSQTLGFYHPDYRTDFEMGDNPYRYYRW